MINLRRAYVPKYLRKKTKNGCISQIPINEVYPLMGGSYEPSGPAPEGFVQANEDVALEQNSRAICHLIAVISPPTGDSSPFASLNLGDARVRRRVQKVLALASESREFSHQEVDEVCGRVTNPNSRILRKVFIETMDCPSRKLGEVKMYFAIAGMVQELRDRLLAAEEAAK